MARDDNWPEKCTLQGCDHPESRPHHHHLSRGHLVTEACICPRVDQPGTRNIDKTKITTEDLVPGITVNRVITCNTCKTTESPSWWKCCPKHATERDIDVVCQTCANNCLQSSKEIVNGTDGAPT